MLQGGRIYKLLIILFAIVAFASSGAASSEAPSFTGIWQVNLEKSTLRGRPVAKVVPFEEPGETAVKLGSRTGRAVFKGDIVQFDFSADWEMNR